MTDKILSDDELKALFSAASTIKASAGDYTGPQEVRSYDFRHPKLFVHEHIHTIEIMHKDFATAVSSVLTNYLNHPVQVMLNTIREQSYLEYINALPDPAVIGFMKLMPSGRFGTLELSNDVALALVDRLLGGQGQPYAKRALTDIELGLVMKPLGKLLDNLNFSWKRKVDQLNFELVHTAVKPEYEGISISELGAEQVFTVHFDMKVGLVLGELTICIPHSFLKPFISELSGSARARNGGKTEYIKQADLEEVDIPLSVLMGEVPVSIGDFIKLQVGDVIPVLPAGANMQALVGDTFRMEARLGRVKNKKAVQIVSAVLQ